VKMGFYFKMKSCLSQKGKKEACCSNIYVCTGLWWCYIYRHASS